MDQEILMKTVPKRIISLVPSQTELLYYLGLDIEVIGITKFCVHPNEWFRNKQRVGGTKNVDIEKIKALQPDLVIANKEENVKEQIEAIQQFASVWVSDVNGLEDALAMIISVGELVNRQVEALKLNGRIEEAFANLKVSAERIVHKFPKNDLTASQHPFQIQHSGYPIRTAYLIWKDPYMVAGGNTFINDMLKLCGLQNVFGRFARYPPVTLAQLAYLNCKLVLLSSEPYPFKQQHIDALHQQLPGSLIILVDGEMFSWYGSRLLKSASYFEQLINEIAFTLPQS